MTVDIKPATESEKTVLGALLIESSNYNEIKRECLFNFYGFYQNE